MLEDQIDPTALTTQQLLREVTSLEKLMAQRMDAMDKAMEIFSDNLTRAPTEVDKQIGHLKSLMEKTFEVMDEKFASVQTQFSERDVRTEQTAKDSKVAVDAALQAAKEAVGKQQEASDRAIAKSEAATTKQLDQIVMLIAANTKASDEKIDDLKKRVATRDGEGGGLQKGWLILVGAVGLIATIVGMLALVPKG